MTIDDIAVDWNSGVLWVGTGEANNSRSSYSGVGMFRSDDGGHTWSAKLGPAGGAVGIRALLPSRTDPDVLFAGTYSPPHIAALLPAGFAYGVFRSDDAGTTWVQLPGSGNCIRSIALSRPEGCTRIRSPGRNPAR